MDRGPGDIISMKGDSFCCSEQPYSRTCDVWERIRWLLIFAVVGGVRTRCLESLTE